MPVKSAGFVKTFQAEWTYDDPGDGSGATLVAVYEDDWEQGNWLARLPARGTAPPAAQFPEFATFILQGRTAVREAGEKVKVTLRYAATVGAGEEEEGEEAGKRYSMQISLAEEPVLTHPRYEDLPDVERVALVQILAGQRFKTEEGKELWRSDVTTELGLELLAKIEDGIEAYLEPKLIWQERQRVDWDAWEDEAVIADAGNIEDEVPGDPPTGGNRNYLYMGARLEQDESGEFADLVREWELSGRNGWDEELYNPVDN